MLRVPIEQAKSGMMLARSINNPKKPEHILLKAGFELDQEHIDRLRELKIFSLWVQYPGLDFLDEMLDPKLVEQQQELYKRLKEDFEDAQNVELDKIDYNEYVTQMANLFKQILSSKNKSAMFINELHGESDDLFLHGTKVASMAMLIGLRLENYLIRRRPNLPMSMATDLTQLGVGCLLHDIGKSRLDESLRKFYISARDMGTKEWQKHTEIGFEMIHNGLDAMAGQVIINHHQHYDGSGFPMRKAMPGLDEPVMPLQGEEIHVFCRIACLANYFDSFRHLPDGTTAPLIVALKRMKNPGYVKWFDPEVYRAFTEAIPAFMPGDQVTLNDGQDVVVIEVNENEPCLPIVRPIDLELLTNPDKEVKPAPPKPVEQPADEEDKDSSDDADHGEHDDDDLDIDLSERSDLHIAQMGGFDVTPYLH